MRETVALVPLPLLAGAFALLFAIGALAALVYAIRTTLTVIDDVRHDRRYDIPLDADTLLARILTGLLVLALLAGVWLLGWCTITLLGMAA